MSKTYEPHSTHTPSIIILVRDTDHSQITRWIQRWTDEQKDGKKEAEIRCPVFVSRVHLTCVVGTTIDNALYQEKIFGVSDTLSHQQPEHWT